MTKICVIGIGYVGLPLALVISENGGNVFALDNNKNKIDELKSGKCFLDEERLVSLWEKQHKNITFITKIEAADAFIIAVPTPLIKDSKSCDYSYVENALNKIISILRPGNIIAITSTCPVGTTNKVAEMISTSTDLEIGKDCFLAYSPERLYPGNTYNEIKENWHLVGGFTEVCTEKIYTFYKSYLTEKMIKTSAKVAEFSKLAENAYRDVNLAFANEIAQLAEKELVNVDEIINVANLHPRVDILNPGIGVGGHCLPIDPWFLNPSLLNTPNSIIRVGRKVNDSVPKLLANKIFERLTKDLLNKNHGQSVKDTKSIDVLLLGYTYKKDSKDIRESPALHIEKFLLEKHLVVFKYDPLIDNLSIEEVNKLNKDSYLTILLVDHTCFKNKLSHLNYIRWKDL